MKNPFRRSEPPESMGAGEMTLLGHLQELRTRLMKATAAVVVGAVVVWIFFEPIFAFLSEPYCELQESSVRDCTFLVTSPLQVFNVKLTMSGYGGVILAMPVILYQLLRFVLPGLYPNEKRALAPYLVVAVLLLIAGLVLAYAFLPRALDVLVNDLGGEQFDAFFQADEYLSFFTKMLLAFGIAFQLPVVLVFLQLVGIVQPATLKRNRRVAVLLVVVLAAIITPTGDPFTLSVLAVPMYLFYELSILIGGRRRRGGMLDPSGAP